MPKTILTALLTFVLVTLLALTALASGMASTPQRPDILLDGYRDSSYTLLADDPSSDLANPGPGEWPGTAWTDLTGLYIADDGVYFYVYVDLPAYAKSISSGEIGLAIDVTGDVAASGGSADPWGNAITYAYTSTHNNVGTTPITATNTILPDFIVRGNIPGISGNPPDDNNGWTELRSWSGTVWSGAGVNWGGIASGGQVGSHIAYVDNQGVEIAIPWADLGLPAGSTLHLEFFATQKGAAKGAFDTLPSDDQSTSWNDATIQRRLASYGDSLNTPTPTGTLLTPTITRTPTATSTGSANYCVGADPGDNNIATDRIFHDSTQLIYRNPLGSIPTNGSATLTLRTCASDVQQVQILVWKTGDPLGAPSNTYSASVGYTSDDHDYWQFDVPGPGTLVDQWYQFKVTDGTTTGYYHVLAGAGNAGPGAWSSSLLDLSWKLGTSVPDYSVPAWMKDAVIYQIFPDRFRNGSLTNDPPLYTSGVQIYGPNTCNGYPHGRGSGPQCVVDGRTWAEGLDNAAGHLLVPSWGVDFYGGDLQGVIEKINAGYFNDLGVNTLYLNPVYNASSNHGYDINDYYNIRPYFGDNAVFDTLIDAAEAHGLRVVLDVVFNHTGSDSIYIDGYGRNRWPTDGACESSSSPFRAWFKTGGTGTQWGCSGDWLWQGWWGFETIPELFENDPVKDFFYRGGSAQSPSGVSVSQFWADKGIAGWRYDVAQDITLGFFSDMRQYVKGGLGSYGDDQTLMLGEVTGGCDWGLYKSYLTENGLDSVMNYCFRDWAISFANGSAPSSFDSSFNSFRATIPESPFYALMNLVDSHDSTRALRLLSDDKNRLKLLVILQMTLPGAPSVYYGDEVGVTGGGDPDNRRTYPWSDAGGSPDTALYDHYKTLIGIRNDHSALRGGDIQTLLVDDSAHVYSYIRWDASETVVVALNNGSGPQAAAIPVGSYLADGTVLTDLLNGGTVTVTGGNINLSINSQWGDILQVTSSPEPTDTPTPTPEINTPTSTATATATIEDTSTPTPTATGEQDTHTPTATATATSTGSQDTSTPTATRTPTPTATGNQDTPTPTATGTPTPTVTQPGDRTSTPTTTVTQSPNIDWWLYLPVVRR